MDEHSVSSWHGSKKYVVTYSSLELFRSPNSKISTMSYWPGKKNICLIFYCVFRRFIAALFFSLSFSSFFHSCSKFVFNIQQTLLVFFSASAEIIKDRRSFLCWSRPKLIIWFARVNHSLRLACHSSRIMVSLLPMTNVSMCVGEWERGRRHVTG